MRTARLIGPTSGPRAVRRGQDQLWSDLDRGEPGGGAQRLRNLLLAPLRRPTVVILCTVLAASLSVLADRIGPPTVAVVLAVPPVQAASSEQHLAALRSALTDDTVVSRLTASAEETVRRTRLPFSESAPLIVVRWLDRLAVGLSDGLNALGLGLGKFVAERRRNGPAVDIDAESSSLRIVWRHPSLTLAFAEGLRDTISERFRPHREVVAAAESARWALSDSLLRQAQLKERGFGREELALEIARLGEAVAILDRAVAEAEEGETRARARLTYAVAQAESGAAWIDVPGLASELPSLAALDQGYAALLSERARLTQRFLANAPPVVRIDGEIAELKRRRWAVVEAHLRLRLDEESERRARLERARAQKRAEFVAAAAALWEWDVIEQDVASRREALQRAEERLRAAQMELGPLVALELTEPVRLEVLPFDIDLGRLVAATLAGFVLGCISAVAAAATDGRVRSLSDLAEASGALVLFELRGAGAQSDASTALVARRLADLGGSARARSLALVSVEESEECATVALAVASAMRAVLGLSVVLVEARLESPRLAERLGLASQPGLHDLLSGSAGIADALHGFPDARPWALPAGTRENGDRFGIERLPELLARLALGFEIVLVDCPPVDTAPSPLPSVAAACDLVVLVAVAGATTRARLSAASDRLASVGASVDACLLVHP